VTQGWSPGAGDQPLPPMNGQVVSPFTQGVLDIRWDDPSILAGNTAYHVVGVNVYRSDVSDRGPFFRINSAPVGGGFYRDRTDNVLVQEVIAWDRWVFQANAPNSRTWMFRTQQPINKQRSMAPFQKPTPGNSPSDVTLTIDGVEVPVHSIFGPTGDVVLINQPTFDQVTEQTVPAVLPTADSAVMIQYYTNRNFIRSGLGAFTTYRLTTVALDDTTPSGYVETDLSYCQPITTVAVESMDYIWREAVRRNSWILQQGGERVKVFIRRQAGVPCTCRLDPRTRAFARQASQRCPLCYGAGYVGGYEGPYDTIIAPDDAERRISQGPTGRRTEHTYEVWTGPTPVLTQRDFIIKQTNERYSVGPVRRPTNRGNLLQQHFNIAFFDEGDIRYQVPIDGVADYPWPETRYSIRPIPGTPIDGAIPDLGALYPVGPDAQSPMETNRTDVPAAKQPRGRTPAWENQNW